jgi:hypothetical protein
MNLILICGLGLAEAAATVGAFWLVMRVLGGKRRSLSDPAPGKPLT